MMSKKISHQSCRFKQRKTLLKYLKKHNQRIFKYHINGEPVPLAKVVETPAPIVWNEYKHYRFTYIQTVKNQHEKYFKKCCFEEGAINPLQFVDGPIKLEATFYMKVHQRSQAGKPHVIAPPTFSLYNFVDHVLQDVIYRKDCTIALVKLQKIYDEVPRTEITITRIKDEK